MPFIGEAKCLSEFMSHSTTRSSRFKTFFSFILRKYPQTQEALEFQINLGGKLEEALGHIFCVM